MPNHVTNRLTITGDEQSLSELFGACFRKQKHEAPDYWREKANNAELEPKERQEWLCIVHHDRNRYSRWQPNG